MEHIFIINPAAGKKDQTEYIKSIVEKRTDINYTIYNTTGLGDATRFVKEKCEENPNEFYKFYACGGDGTVNEVVNGLIDYSNAAFTVYPCGSGNDFVKASKNYDFTDINALINGEQMEIDLIKANGKYSVNIVNAGFDAATAHRMVKFKRWPLVSGKMAYNLAIVVSLMREMKHKGKVYVDDELVYDGNFLLTAACNGICCGGSFYFAPNAEIDNGLIELMLVKQITRMKFISNVKYIKKGTYQEKEKLKKYISLFKCKKVRIETEKNIVYAVDGETQETKSVEIEICPKMVKFFRPKN